MAPCFPVCLPVSPWQYRYRTVKFDGNTSNMVIIQQPGDGCLHLIDPNYLSEDTYPGLPENLTKSIDLSNINQVERNGDNMAIPSRYFGPEPARDWCYYFEKAELARQYGDWEEVLMNYESASSAGFTARQPVENLVFIEGLARLGKPDKAARLTEKVISGDRKLCRALTAAWQRAAKAAPEIQPEAMKQMEELSVLPECK